jgi:hypothetical protein
MPKPKRSERTPGGERRVFDKNGNVIAVEYSLADSSELQREFAKRISPGLPSLLMRPEADLRARRFTRHSRALRHHRPHPRKGQAT